MILDPSWSLNRVCIVDLPGVGVPDDVKGKVAYELVSAWRLTEMVRQQAETLQIDPGLSDHALRLAFDVRLESDSPSVRAAADEIARTVGRNLGYVLLVLKRGDQANREARPEWGSAHWDRWAGIKRVWLGGGLMSGHLGPHVVQHANHVIVESGMEDLRVLLSPYGADLPLVGAARHVPAGVDTAVVLDFGGTMIKRARIVLQNDLVAELHRLSSLPAIWTSIGSQDEPTRQTAEALINGMTSIIAETWPYAKTAGKSPASTVPVCLAAYVKNGKPMVAHAGGYYQSNLVTDNLEDELGRRASATLGTPIRVKLLHDGSAAAATYAGKTHAAVIMMGTALGTGFPGDAAGLREICDDFKRCCGRSNSR